MTGLENQKILLRFLAGVHPLNFGRILYVWGYCPGSASASPRRRECRLHPLHRSPGVSRVCQAGYVLLSDFHANGWFQYTVD